MQEKYLKMLPGWILRIFKRELNLYASDGDTSEDLQDRHETGLVNWRQNHRLTSTPADSKFKLK
jgi:hypothetical protein